MGDKLYIVNLNEMILPLKAATKVMPAHYFLDDKGGFLGETHPIIFISEPDSHYYENYANKKHKHIPQDLLLYGLSTGPT